MSEPLGVELQELKKRFTRGDQEVTVLDGVTVKVPPGDFVALMGPSGSGKSTTLNMIAGLDRPTAGKLMVGSFEPAKMGDNELCTWRSQHVGFIFQRYHLLETLTAAQNIEVPLLLFKLSGSERKRRVQTALELVGLKERGDHFPRHLSGGQEQRVAIARAIVTDPSVLLADEPTGDLDAKAAGEIMDLIVTANQQLKKTVIMVTHDPKVAARARRLLSLEKGRIGEVRQQSATPWTAAPPRPGTR
jgi:putative ABC transport system ATP-binding protein